MEFFLLEEPLEQERGNLEPFAAGLLVLDRLGYSQDPAGGA
jgi:hypothetical protein